MTAFLLLVWLFGSITGVFFMIRSGPDWPLVASRWRAAGVFPAAFIGARLLTGVIATRGGAAGAGVHGAAAAKTPAEVQVEARAKAGDQARAQLDDMRWRPAMVLSLERTKAWKAGFDTVFMLSGEIRSTSRLGVKDPVIQYALYSETDTPLGGVRQTLFKFVSAGQTLSFDSSTWASRAATGTATPVMSPALPC